MNMFKNEKWGCLASILIGTATVAIFPISWTLVDAAIGPSDATGFYAIGLAFAALAIMGKYLR